MAVVFLAFMIMTFSLSGIYWAKKKLQGSHRGLAVSIYTVCLGDAFVRMIGPFKLYSTSLLATQVTATSVVISNHHTPQANL